MHLYSSTRHTSGCSVSNLDGAIMVNNRIIYIIKNNYYGNNIPSHDENKEPLLSPGTCATSLPSCMNPPRLTKGAQSENSCEDRIVSGTLLRGDKNPNSTITEQYAKRRKLSKILRSR